MAFNRGEWSELYAIFYLLSHRNLKIVNSNMEIITEELFRVESILTEKKNGFIEFRIDENIVRPIILKTKVDQISVKDIDEFRKAIYEGITNAKIGGGAFHLDDVNKWLIEKNIYSNYKGKSGSKEDITLINLDLTRNDTFKLGYSVKSQLGSPATILNASKKTDFRYKVKGLTTEDIGKINQINTRTKLIDRLNAIYKLGGTIEYDSVVSNVFKKNLQMIDMALPEALGEVLINSYKNSEKNLLNLFKESTIYKDETIAMKKMKDFLLASSLGMFPGKEWDGKFTADGGIIIVSLDSNIYVLDMVYFKEELEKYLVTNTKLDSPSSTRYKMLELFNEDGEIFFTLNLQVRYIK